MSDMRKAAVVIAVSSLLTAAGVGLGIGSSMTSSITNVRPIADDTSDYGDISDYDGTKCDPNQFFDATDGSCDSDAVSNDPQGVVNQQQPGLSDPGTACKEGQYYSVDEQQCLTDAVTNNPQSTITPEGENPADYTVPSATGIPDCANGGSDPMWICA